MCTDVAKTMLQSDINTTRNELGEAKAALETKIDTNKAALDDLQSQIDDLKASLQTSAAADGGDGTCRATGAATKINKPILWKKCQPV